MLAKHARRKYLWHPLNWPSWLLALFLYPLAYLPYTTLVQLGRLLGKMCFYFMNKRRSIADINLRLCFPELSDQERHALLKAHFIELGIAILETNVTWWRNIEPFLKRCEFVGLEKIKREHELGHGILLIGAHFTTLDITGALLSHHLALTVTMRQLKNPVFNFIVKRSRQKHISRTLDRHEIKKMLHTLKEGNILWYAPDQDYGPENSIFVPFFGQEAASLKVTPKLAKRTKAKVFFLSHFRENNQYHITLEAMPPNFPSDDLALDVKSINDHLENIIRQHPEQYLWIHRRFKTASNGQSSTIYELKQAKHV